MSKKILTVVIPTYNRSKLFKKSLDNFIKFKNYIDIFIIEDGSKKEIVEQNKNYLKKFNNILLSLKIILIFLLLKMVQKKRLSSKIRII